MALRELKEFVHNPRECVLMEDIIVPYTQRKEVWDWCELNKITAEYQGTFYGRDLWRVENDEHRVRFILKWL
jgi:hypothetical protein